MRTAIVTVLLSEKRAIIPERAAFGKGGGRAAAARPPRATTKAPRRPQ
ncbi:MAG: hypothetical protein LBE06_12265 [Azoarcus sp.]|nr:hypothetical protein [Azoarcus sp.]